MLGADSKALSNLLHISPDVMTIDDCCATSGCIQTYNVDMHMMFRLYVYTVHNPTIYVRSGSGYILLMHMYICTRHPPVRMDMVVVFPAPLCPSRAVI